MTDHSATLMALATTCMLVAGEAVARDFPEPHVLSDPWLAITRGALPSTDARSALLLAPAAYGDIAYHDYAFSGGPHDSFSVRTRVGGVPVAIGPVALGIYWSSFLLVGPLEPTDDAASIAEWWINAAQFEYGLIASVRIPHPFRSIALEYGRTSHHPLRSGYSEIASDVLSATVWLRSWQPGYLVAGLGLRASWIDLYDFWDSDLLKPRTRLRIAAPMEVAVALFDIGGAKIQMVLTGEPRLLFLRTEEVEPETDLDPLVQIEVEAELGLRIRGVGRADIALEFFTSEDTEQRRTEPSPLTTLGIVVRIGG